MNCEKCGGPLTENSRCCLRCGTLNPNHPDNAKAISQIQANSVNNQQVNNNQVVNNIQETNIVEGSKTVSTNMLVFLIVNGLLYGLGAISFLLDDSILGIGFTMFITWTISYFYIVCVQLLFIKANVAWWGLFVPIYNIYLLNKIAFGNGLMLLVPIVPIFIYSFISALNIDAISTVIGLIAVIIYGLYSPILTISLARRFNCSGILTFFFPYVMIPVMAFSGNYQE